VDLYSPTYCDTSKGDGSNPVLRRIYETSLDDIGLSVTCGIVVFASQFTAVTVANSLLGSNDTNFFSADTVFSVAREAE